LRVAEEAEEEAEEEEEEVEGGGRVEVEMFVVGDMCVFYLPRPSTHALTVSHVHFLSS
jgi:collagenase-like PrtC family protease